MIRYESESAALRAEVGRLRDTNLALECIRDERPALVAQLAAANALLERASHRLDEVNYPKWRADYRRHLSGQPVVPSRAEFERNALAATLERVRKLDKYKCCGATVFVLASALEKALAGAPAPEGESK